MKTIGIYPGNFQPPTRAHLHVYKKLRQAVGPDTFVVTTDRTPTPDAPLNFGDKEQIWVRQGVPASSIQRVQDWKHPEEIFHKFSGEHTAAVFALSQRETDEVAGKKTRSSQIKPDIDTNNIPTTMTEIEQQPSVDKEVWMENDRKLSYFQPYRGNENSMKPFKEHAYVMIIDDSKIEGRPVSTANIRQVFGSPRYTENAKKKFFRFVFGWFDAGLYTLMLNKFRSAHQVTADEEPPLPSTETPQQVVKPVPSSFRENITKMVHEILKEIMDEDYSSSMTTSIGGDSSGSDMAKALDKKKSPAQQKSDQLKQKQDLVKQKQQAERDLDGIKKDLKWKQSDVLRKRKDEIPNKRKELDAINKQIAQPQSIDSSTPL